MPANVSFPDQSFVNIVTGDFTAEFKWVGTGPPPPTVTVRVTSLTGTGGSGRGVNFSYWEFKDANGLTSDMDIWTDSGTTFWTYVTTGQEDYVLETSEDGTASITRTVTTWIEGRWDSGQSIAVLSMSASILP